MGYLLENVYVDKLYFTNEGSYHDINNWRLSPSSARVPFDSSL